MRTLLTIKAYFFTGQKQSNYHLLACALLSLACLFTHQSFAQNKVDLLFSDAFADKEKQLPMPERYYKLLKQIEKDLSIEFEIKLYPWNRAVNIATTEGKLIFALSLTPEREKLFKFTEPITNNYIWLVTREDGVFPYTTMQDLKGKTIDIFRGAKYGGEFDALKDKLFKIEEGSGSVTQRLIRLHNKRVDAMVYSSENKNAKEVEKLVNDILKTDPQYKHEAEQYQFKIIPIPLFKDGVRFAQLQGKNDKLIDDINLFILKMQK